MKRVLLLVTTAILMASIPALAESVQGSEDHQIWSLNDLVEGGARALNEAIHQGLALFQDHVDLNVRTGPSSQEGEKSTRFRLNIFPNGKRQASDRFGIEGTLRYSHDPSFHHFNFDFHLIEPSESSQDYI